MNEQGLMAVLKNDNSNPLVQLSNNVTDVVTRQNTLGTERNSQSGLPLRQSMKPPPKF